MTAELQVGQVWEHRHDCFLCGTPQKPHRHRYVIVKAADVILVRDLQDLESRSQGRLRRIGDAYAMQPDIFGSLAKGGLRLAGTLAGGVLEPVDELDERAIKHERVSMHRRPKNFSSAARRGSFVVAGDLGDEEAPRAA